jgi:acyl-CoA thioesterase-1
MIVHHGRGGNRHWLRCIGLFGAALWICATACNAHAAHIDIVALGASNTIGAGVGMSNAWPALLERLLRDRGYDVTIANAGMSMGATSAQIRDAVDSAVPAGTKVVILQMFYRNDYRWGVSREENEANIKAAIARVRARGARVVLAGYSVTSSIPASYSEGPYGHFTAQGHALIAERLLPQVIKAIGSAR